MATVIKLEKQHPTIQARKRVAAYARVSMECDRLQHSLAAQVSFYSELIQSHPEWQYVGVYADYGISGTRKEKRPEFMRMLEDAEAGKIDIILTKSLSRFARNTVDMLETIRHLKELGVEVRFEKEKINTLDGKGEVLLTLLSSFAQEEVRSLSENVKWGVRKRFEKGIPNGHFRVLGYHWEGDQLVISPDEAAIVRRIFQNFLDGKSRIETAKELDAEGIRTVKGYKFQDSSIKVVLTNITYTGNMLLMKEYITDPISHKRKKNRGELQQYFVENTHEPIIDMETFQYVQAEMARRRALGPFGNKSLNLTCFSTIIKCELCGKSYVRSNRFQKGKPYPIWTCSTRKRTSHPSKDIPETILKRVCCEVLGLDEFSDEAFIEAIERITVIGKDQMDFHFRDGHVVHHKWVSTAKKDSWTPELRAAKAAYNRQHQITFNPSCFTSRIICETCNASYHRQTQNRANGRAVTWHCVAKGHGCKHKGLHDSDIREAVADMMLLPSFDEVAFRQEIDHLSVNADLLMTAHFRDGHTATHQFSGKKKQPKWTAEHRQHFNDAQRRRKEAKQNACSSDNPRND